MHVTKKRTFPDHDIASPDNHPVYKVLSVIEILVTSKMFVQRISCTLIILNIMTT